MVMEHPRSAWPCQGLVGCQLATGDVAIVYCRIRAPVATRLGDPSRSWAEQQEITPAMRLEFGKLTLSSTRIAVQPRRLKITSSQRSI